MKKTLQNKGFTILETLLGISIFILILLGITLLARNIFTYNSFISAGFTNIESAKRAMQIIPAEIRTASSASTGAYAVSDATATSFIFYSDIYDNGLKERVRYFLSGSSLQKGVTIPTGSPLAYDTATEKITTLVSNVTNTSIFSYYNENYYGTGSPLASPVDVSAVTLIKITIVVDKDPSRAPPPFTFSTQVSLRNLKDNL